MVKTVRSISMVVALCLAGVAGAEDWPNVLVIWGDDTGVHDVSAYNHGMMGYQTPNIDRLAKEGAMFTHAYAQQGSTAGRAAFVLGQHPFRTGLLTIGMPGSEHGIPDWAPTIADLLKQQGYATAQFGMHRLGDRDRHLPTSHGFDEFFGNLYARAAEESAESGSEDPTVRQRPRLRGLIRSNADGEIDDTGPMTRERMKTANAEFLAASLDFIDRAHSENTPFFVWHNATRIQVRADLNQESGGVNGAGNYAEAMVEHDGEVGQLLGKLDDLGITDNTIVIYSTDNGAETKTWFDGAASPFHGEKGSTWEGGYRVPMLVRWPGTVAAGTKSHEIISHEDWLPTLLAAAGVPDIVEKLKKGYRANGRRWKVHLDGYDFGPYLRGETDTGPRDSILYFAATGDLNAVRVQDLKAHFAIQTGGIETAERQVPARPLVVNLKTDPYEKAALQSEMQLRAYADNSMWI